MKNPSAIPIQNGGFSLRSRKLLKAPSSLGALHYFTEEPILQGEDVQLSGIFRQALERNGIKFAPTSIARSFALEYAGHQFHNDLLFENLVGIHGKTRQLISRDTIRVPIPENEVIKQFRKKSC